MQMQSREIFGHWNFLRVEDILLGHHLLCKAAPLFWVGGFLAILESASSALPDGPSSIPGTHVVGRES